VVLAALLIIPKVMFPSTNGEMDSLIPKIINILMLEMIIAAATNSETTAIFARKTFFLLIGYENSSKVRFPAYSSITIFENIADDNKLKANIQIVLNSGMIFSYPANIFKSWSFGSICGA
jgi:hypothetical protein